MAFVKYQDVFLNISTCRKVEYCDHDCYMIQRDNPNYDPNSDNIFNQCKHVHENTPSESYRIHTSTGKVDTIYKGLDAAAFAIVSKYLEECLIIHKLDRY